MKTVTELLRSIPLFQSLQSAEIDYLAARCSTLTLAQDTIFIREGELGDAMFLVHSGHVEIIKALGTAEESLLAVHGEGELIGEMSLLNPQQPRSASARARSQVTLLVVSRADLEQLLPRFPHVAIDLLHIMSARLYGVADQIVRDLTVKNRELARAYADLQAAQAQLVRQEVLQKELQHAQRMQQQMLPATLPRVDKVDIGATMIAARMVGGDLYDVLVLDEQRLLFIVGDVSGKGIPAALYMALVCSLLRAVAPAAATPAAALQLVNQHLSDRDMDSMFVTLLLGELNIETGAFSYHLAGHDRPLLWRSGKGVVAKPLPRSLPLGILPDAILQSDAFTLARGSIILFYTDGVTEAPNSAGELFGRDRLSAVVNANAHLPAQALCDQVVAAVHAHQGDAPQFDDITLLALRLH